MAEEEAVDETLCAEFYEVTSKMVSGYAFSPSEIATLIGSRIWSCSAALNFHIVARRVND